jgi:hypothetical protein
MPTTYQGAPCKRGHLSEDGKTRRSTTNGHCIQCKREWSQRPEAKKRRAENQKQWLQTPEGRVAHNLYQKLYNQRPEMREKRRTYENTYRPAYNARPDVKARKREYYKAYDVFTKYGLTMADYNAIFLKQSGLCCICSRELDQPHIDHDHKTTKVRGILCASCNVGLGSFRDDPELCKNAAVYLLRTSTGA